MSECERRPDTPKASTSLQQPTTSAPAQSKKNNPATSRSQIGRAGQPALKAPAAATTLVRNAAANSVANCGSAILATKSGLTPITATTIAT